MPCALEHLVHARPVVVGRDEHAAHARDRLADHRRDPIRPDALDRLLELGHAVVGAVLHPVGVGRGQVHEALWQRPYAHVVHVDAGGRPRAVGDPVIAALAGEDHVAVRFAAAVVVEARHQHGDLVRLAAAGREVDLLEPGRGELDQPARELDGGLVRVVPEGAEELELLVLVARRLGDLLAPVADLPAPQGAAGRVEILAPGDVPDVHAVALDDDDRLELLLQDELRMDDVVEVPLLQRPRALHAIGSRHACSPPRSFASGPRLNACCQEAHTVSSLCEPARKDCMRLHWSGMRPQDSAPPTHVLATFLESAGPALVSPDDGWTLDHAGLLERVDALAAQLAGAGVEPGGAVGIVLEHGPEGVLAFLAAARLNAVAIPLNPRLHSHEMRSAFEDRLPSLVLVGEEGSSAASEAAEASGLPVRVLRGGPRAALDGAAGDPASLPAADPDAVALLLHTSGTTSRPKAVPLRQRNLAATAQAIAHGYGLGAGDASYCVMPLFHVHGLVASTLGSLAGGGAVVVPRRVRPSALWGHVQASRVTWLSAVPTILAKLPAADRAGTPLRFVRSCSSSLDPTLWRSLEERFAAPVVEAYGMTEAAHQMTSNPLPPGERRPGTVGLPAGAEVAVIGADWAQLPDGQAGEVAVRGPGVVDEYLGNEEATRTSFRDGWFRTGDLGRLSGDGYLTLEGRLKELINRGGEKIAPREIDEALLAHPEVREAVAFGRPDSKWGEVVEAVVVLDSPVSTSDLLAHCAERLASFKVPRRLHVVDEIPKGADRQGPAADAGRSAGPMKIAVVGAGAIGGFVGACLARGGAETHLVARGPHLEAMRRARRARHRPERGLHRATALHGRPCRDRPGRLRVPRAEGLLLRRGGRPAPTADGRRDGGGGGAERDPVVVLPRPRRAPRRPPHRERGPGRRGERRHRARAGDRLRHLPGRGDRRARRDPPRRGNRLALGEPDRSSSRRCAELSEALASGGLKAPVDADLRDQIWLKLMGNATLNPLSALTGATLAEICGYPPTRELVAGAMAEIVAVGAALGCTPRVSIERRLDGAARVGAHRTSMLQDLDAGRRLELEVLLAAPIELAGVTGVDTPRLRALHAATALLDAVRRGVIAEKYSEHAQD